MLVRIAWASFRSRRLVSILTIFSIALGVALVLTVNKVRKATEEAFVSSVSGVDLLVGARGGTMNLLLYSVFNIGNSTNNLSARSWQYWSRHPAVEWTIPWSLGDGYRGYRVVGTNTNFFQYYRFRGQNQIRFEKGEAFDEKKLWQAVVGAEVAKTLDLDLGEQLSIAHGDTKGDSLLEHSDRPFTLVGILAPTGTVLDKAIYVSLQSLEALHIDWEQGGPPAPGKVTPLDQINVDSIEVSSITSFFLRARSRIDSLRLQREINDWSSEPLTAIIPGVALADLWRTLGYFEVTLRIISWLVTAVAMIGLSVVLVISLHQRRREMAILRAIGAGLRHIAALLVIESVFFTFGGILVGFLLSELGFLVVTNWLGADLGITMENKMPGLEDTLMVTAVLIAGFVAGLLAAWRARNLALKDGLRPGV